MIETATHKTEIAIFVISMREGRVSLMTRINATACTHDEALERAGYNDLEQKFEKLRNSDPLSPNQLPHELPTTGGIYLFLNGESPFYVGRSENLQTRYGDDTSTSVERASLALKMARRGEGTDATYKKGTDAKNLHQENVSGFQFYFDVARERIKLFNVQYIIEQDDTMQSLLEMYVIVRLGLDTADAYNQLKTS